MLESWAVTNFKSIPQTRVIKADGEETDTLDLKPLTVFCGANSSGKSSLIQSILMMAQTMRNWDNAIPLALNGAYVNLGTFNDIKTIHNGAEEIGIRFTYKPEKEPTLWWGAYRNECVPLVEEGEKERFRIDAISSEVFFSPSGKKEKTKILPEISRMVFSVIFYKQKKDESASFYVNDPEKGRYVLNWIISKPGDRELYDFKEEIVFPDGKTVNIARKKEALFVDEFINNEFKEKVTGQFPFEAGEITCDRRHFFMEAINFKVKNVYLHLLDITESVLSHLGISLVNGINMHLALLNSGWGKGDVIFDMKHSMPQTLYDYIKDHVLNDMEGVDDLLTLDADSEAFIRYKDWGKKFDKLTEEKKKLILKRLNEHKDKIVVLTLNRFKVMAEDIENRFKDLSESGSDDKACKALGHFFSRTKSVPLRGLNEFTRRYLFVIYDWFSKDIYYLGPLREDPNPLYPFPRDDNSFDLGRKGENTSGVLFIYGEKVIEDIPLPVQTETSKKSDDKITVIDAVRKWLSYIGVADDITAEIIESGISLKVKTPGSDKFTGLTNVGVGVSQVLPIVVMCLTAKKGNALIFEQPELHLHPKMQTKLAEFFMAVAASGVQCIIETHSEHFINAMRYNIASAPLGKEDMIEKSVIYFVEKIENKSIFREIKINDLGIIPRWPRDFFDENIKSTDKIIQASSRKWSEKSQKNGGADDE